MNKSSDKIYNKLVRDKIPEIILKNGESPVVRVLNEEEYKKELERKLLEEYHEVLDADNREHRLEELADILEVISALSAVESSSLEEVSSIMEEKRQKRGGFSKKLFLEKVTKR